MGESIKDLHFILFPLMSRSHLIPFTHLASMLSCNGPSVTLVTTPANVGIVESTAVSSISVLSLPFPDGDFGLPAGCENIDSLPSFHLFDQFLVAARHLHPLLLRHLRILHPRPSCLISDIVFPWTSSVAANLRVPHFVFHVNSCFALVCCTLSRSLPPNADFISLPGSKSIKVCKSHIPNPRSNGMSELLFEEMDEAEKKAAGVLVNTFEEMEMEYVEEYRKSINRNCYCVGPVYLNENGKKLSGGDDRDSCMDWLDTMEENSVVYSCFGSLAEVPFERMRDVGLGLEECGWPFLWVIGERSMSGEMKRWLEEERFEERVEGRGVVVSGWVRQREILRHPAVGCFLSHCGWNSTMDGVAAGVPMATVPMFAEQFLNEKVVVEVLGVGVQVRGEGRGLSKSEVKKAVERLMEEEGDKGKRRRERSREVMEMARAAIGGGGSSVRNLAMLIREVEERRRMTEEDD